MEYVYCIYIPEYPAWAHARTLSPQSPVVVVAGGRVVACSNSQQLRTISRGDSVDRVRRLCPGAVIRVRDLYVERASWDDVLEAIHMVTPFIEVLAPPYVFFSGADFPEVKALALRLSIQIGAGSNRSAAQLAAIRSASGHVLRLRARRWKSFLKQFNVHHLTALDFDEDMVEQLVLFGYRTLGGVQGLNRRQLQAQFGEEGGRLHDLLHPADEKRIPLYTPPSGIEIWHHFDDSVVAEPGILEPVLFNLTVQAAASLGSLRCQRLRLGIAVVRQTAPRWTGRIFSIPQSQSGSLNRLGRPLLGSLMEFGLEVDGLGLRLDSLRPPSVHQGAFFDERPAVLNTVRNVHRRWPGGIQRATLRPDVLFAEDEMLLENFDRG